MEKDNNFKFINMRHNYTNTLFNKILVLAILLGTFSIYGQDITYTFANAQNTNDGSNDFYEVDVLIESTADFKLGSGLLYFNYNTAAFGMNVSGNSMLEYTQPTGYILSELVAGVFPVYSGFVQNDNTASRFAVSYQQGFSAGSIAANNVTGTAKTLFHLKIQYVDVNEDPMVTFEDGAIYTDQTFTACGPLTPGTADCSNFPGIQLVNDSFDSLGGTLGIDDELLAQSLRFYPNPVKDLLTIDSELELTKVEIYSVLGKKIKEINAHFNAIPMANLSNGIYIIRMYSENGLASKKLIKQ